ncbi:MAG: YdaS family helix-turn-helix protein [Pseudomonadota bacterium]|nr:YdaS family helix-turn-helix protein [Pseudomonadota bacterium]MEC8887337.1 YdaS family helix-turn-helix protein [Pseudomonadota bacterium]
METIRAVIKSAGGAVAVAQSAELTDRAVYKWIKNNSMPYTDYTGKTNYAQIIADMTKGKVTRDQILNIGISNPDVVAS